MRRLTGAVAVVLVLSTLAACGGGKVADPPVDPVSTPASAASSSAAASSSPHPPVMPAAAAEHTEAGAKAFVTYYWAMVDYAEATLDTAPLKALATKACDGCRGGAGAIDKVRESGGEPSGGKHTVIGIGPGPSVGGRLYFAVAVQHTAESVTGGSSPTSYPSGSEEFSVGLAWANGWRLASLEVAQP